MWQIIFDSSILKSGNRPGPAISDFNSETSMLFCITISLQLSGNAIWDSKQHRVLSSCGFQWCGVHSCGVSKKSWSIYFVRILSTNSLTHAFSHMIWPLMTLLKQIWFLQIFPRLEKRVSQGPGVHILEYSYLLNSTQKKCH